MAGLVPPGAEALVSKPAAVSESRGVRVFGDSLALQAWRYVQRLAADRNEEFDGGAYGGTALCDWIPAITRTLATDRPSYLVLAFAGNNLTPCTRAPDGTRRYGAALAELYGTDTQRAITAASRTGTQVFLVGPPAMMNPVSDDDSSRLRVTMQRLASSNPGVEYLDANAALSPHGFRVARECRSFETPALGCRDNSIVIRSDDGVHLATPAGGDRAYSAGAWDYATLLMRGIPPAA